MVFEKSGTATVELKRESNFNWFPASAGHSQNSQNTYYLPVKPIKQSHVL